MPQTVILSDEWITNDFDQWNAFLKGDNKPSHIETRYSASCDEFFAYVDTLDCMETVVAELEKHDRFNKTSNKIINIYFDDGTVMRYLQKSLHRNIASIKPETIDGKYKHGSIYVHENK